MWFAKESATSLQYSVNVDHLLSVMVMCKESVGKHADPFVRLVTSAPEPMSILCTNRQLQDLVRFCTSPEASYPLCIDPTLINLGDFSVTVCSYQHLLLQHAAGKTKKTPVFLGPMLVHRRKDFSSYHFLSSSLLSLEPSLIDLRSFGTDGEVALFKAFSLQFQKATHLHCFLHFRDNCMMKLWELGVKNDVAIGVIQDIFGSPLQSVPGIVNVHSQEDVYVKLSELRGKCNLVAPGFHEWFLKYKAEDLVASMTQSVRESAGLKNPPEPFYTNDMESINRLIKCKVTYKATQWPEFCRLAEDIVREQQEEVEKVIIGTGEYRFKWEYKHLEIPIHKWNSKSRMQWQAYLHKVNKTSVQEARLKPVSCVEDKAQSSSNSSSNPPVKVNHLLQNLALFRMMFSMVSSIKLTGFSYHKTLLFLHQERAMPKWSRALLLVDPIWLLETAN